MASAQPGNPCIYAAEARQGLFHHRLDLALFRHIGLHKHRIAVELFDGFYRGLTGHGIHLSQDDSGSFARVPFRDPPADTSAGAGYDRHLVLKLHSLIHTYARTMLFAPPRPS